MSFFFAKASKGPKAAPSKPKALGAPRSARANVAAVVRLGCLACPLNNAPGIVTQKMEPTLGDDGIYFLAEAPGKEDDETTGQPLTGPPGALLRQCIRDSGVSVPSFDNVINCKTPGNRTPIWNEVEACRPRRIKWIEQQKPKLIVGLGVIPLHFMLHSTDISGMRGRLFAVKVGNHSCWFMPTYHPSFILKTAYDKRKPLNSKLGHCFRTDVKRACEIADKLEPPVIESEQQIRSGIEYYDGSSQDHYGRLCTLLNLAREVPTKSVDIETQGLRPFGKGANLLTIAFSFGTTNFAFAFNSPKSKWENSEKFEIRSRVRGILQDDTLKIAHNAPFEIEWFIQSFGREVVNHQAWECTMMQAHFLDERKGKQGGGKAPYQSLDFLCKQHFGVAYKSMFKLNKKDMGSCDLNEVLTYNCVDTKYTLRLWKRQTKLLKEQGLHDAYLEALPRQPTVALMQHMGIGVNQSEIAELQIKLEGPIKHLEMQINLLPDVRAFKAKTGNFNPLSQTDLINFFKELHFGLKNDEGKLSVDKEILEGIDHPLANLIIELRNKTKLKSTYVDCFKLGKGDFIWPDGLIHTSFNTTFTETSRLSSDQPNLQNFPKRHDAWVRKSIVAPKGHVLLAFDYGQLEGCTAAMCSKDKTLVKALWESYDIHLEWAQKTAALYPDIIGGPEVLSDKAKLKKFRSVIKNKLVFPAIFGASNESIAGYLQIPLHIVNKIMQEFWATFTGLGEWQSALMKTYYETGWVTSPTGRLHRYPLTKNQVINFPVQSVAADIVCDAMNVLSEHAVQTRQWHLHPILNVHDDLTFVVPDSLIPESVEIIVKTMLTPDYDFINVPLSVEVSEGKNWFEMRELDKFFSNEAL